MEMNIYCHGVWALAIRVGFILYSSIQDSYSEVKYTDIDYEVFTDAARYVWNGESPFKRPTYRYSPILAFMLTPNIFLNRQFGKLMFSVFDIVTSLLIYHIQQKYFLDVQLCKKCAFLWLYNPLTIVISTRGSSESVMTTLIMLSIFLFINNKTFLLGLVYGFAVHMKIYPCIYSMTFYFCLSHCIKDVKGWIKVKELFYPNKSKIIFLISSALGLMIPTFISAYFYGYEYIDEALLYHLKRKDVRHNFSPYFYFLYLSDTVSPNLSTIVSFSSFFIQLFLVSLISWVFYLPQTLPACLFLQTFSFVTFNKVCTSQYFLWYLCLFPLCYPLVNSYPKYVLLSFSVWFIGQALWLIPAYFLEFRGKNTFLLIFFASLFFFVINVLLISMFIKLLTKYTKLSLKNKNKKIKSK